MDVYRAKEMEQFEHWQEVYEAMGYTVLLTGAAEGKGVAELGNC